MQVKLGKVLETSTLFHPGCIEIIALCPNHPSPPNTTLHDTLDDHGTSPTHTLRDSNNVLTLPAQSDAATLKDQGNKAFAAKDYNKAIELFSQAIDLDKTNHVLYSNRSAAKAGLKDWAGALEDAEEVREA